MNCRRAIWALGTALVLAVALAAPTAWAQGNPCAGKTNPCAARAKNPCAANPCAPKGKAMNPCGGNPCAAKNPCGGSGGPWVQGAARYVLGEVVSAGPSSLSIRTASGPVTVAVDSLTQVREGTARKAVKDLKPKERVTVSVVEQGSARRAAFVYVASAAAGNPCAGNPCAAKNPCGGNPCAAKAKNPCAGNPCAGKANPCAAKGNPCAAKNPCGGKR